MWTLYSKKMQQHASHPQHGGFFTASQAAVVRCVVGKEGSLEEGLFVKLYLLVEEKEGVILEAKFQAMGPPDFIAMADALCEMLPSKNYAQASRMGVDLLEKRLRDGSDRANFSPLMQRRANLIFFALFEACRLCQDIATAEVYTQSPVVQEGGGGQESEHQKCWDNYSLEEKLFVIRSVVAVDIAPYIALDGGGIEVVKLKEWEVMVQYQGACTTCFSSIGATLRAIQQVLRDKVHSQLIVVPDPSVLQLSGEVF